MFNMANSMKRPTFCDGNRKKVRVLHILEDFSLRNTGVTSIVRQVAQWQAKKCEWVGVYVTGKSELSPPDGVHVHCSDLSPYFGGWRYPKGGESELKKLVQEFGVTLIHLHGLWRAAPIVGMKVASREGIPSILSVHGQTSPWALEGQGILKQLKKKLYWKGFAKAQLGDVSVLHAITPLEAQHLERFFGRHVDAVIPNAVDLDQIASSEMRPKPSPEPIIAFLGRMHPVKGIEKLIRAFSNSSLPSHWRLILAGPEEVPEYAKFLRAIAKSSKRAKNIEFCGALYGQEKINFLQRAWVLAAPSHTEVIGMVNLEAASHHVPSITTYETGLTDWNTGGGLLINATEGMLQIALEEVACWTEAERVERGNASYDLVRRQYSLDVAGRSWIGLYRRLLGWDND
jgi:glycosyltransferase involved in cell wall biosynthesis